MAQKQHTRIASLLCGLFLLCGGLSLTGCSSSAEKQLSEFAYSLNAQCPIELGDGMAIARVVTLPERTLQYNIVSNYLRKSTPLDGLGMTWESMAEKYRGHMIENLKANPALKKIKRIGITFVYHYRDNDGNSLMEFTITPEDY